jgi:hypothetical protein
MFNSFPARRKEFKADGALNTERLADESEVKTMAGWKWR